MWVQSEYAYIYHYAYRPLVWIESDGTNGILNVDGLTESIGVVQTQGTYSRVKGAFEGWTGNTVVELQNGQVWEQDRYYYHYHYAYEPYATVYRHHGTWLMHVNGLPKPAKVRKRY
jgi:hypothetical protein